MKIWNHLLIVAIASLAFYFLGLLIPPPGEAGFRWYHILSIIPLSVGIAFGRGWHDINFLAAHIAVLIQFLAVGLFVDFVVWIITRRSGKRITNDHADRTRGHPKL